MSIVNVILLSSTPIAGLAALLGMCRFEKWALDDRTSTAAAGEALERAAAAPVATAEVDLRPGMLPEPLHQAA